MQCYLNLAGYRFVDIDDPEALRASLDRSAARLGLLGTILVAPEGLNLFLAGAARSVETFVAELDADPRFAGMMLRRTVSDGVPFKHLRSKVKPEIITMRGTPVRPGLARASSIEPVELLRWLDQGHDDAGRPLVLLDTRNTFEVEAGSFDAATHWNLENFGQFPQAVDARAGELAGKTVVTFCTGGIRCEKAALVLDQAGVDHVRQLEGGILNWFEQVGSQHWHGECFVFDERRAVAAEAIAPGL
ncbi:sulfurtransferase [soil metagenome]